MVKDLEKAFAEGEVQVSANPRQDKVLLIVKDH